MKQIKHLLGMAAMLLFAASCSSDEPVDPVNPVVDKDQTRYLSVAISSPAGTRVDYSDGEENESAIDHIVFVFYDQDGNYLSHTDAIEDGTITDDLNNDNISRFWSRVVSVDLVQGQNMPAYVVAFVNGSDLTAVYDQKSLDDLRSYVITASLNTTTGNFPMSNSVYYDVNPFTGQKEKIMATPILNSQLFDTKAKAEAAITANADGILEIYVERYAAKIGLTVKGIEPKKLKSSDDGSEVSLSFVPEYWRPNAVDYKSYVTKKFALPDTQDEIASFTDVDNRFATSGMPTWNDETNHRSYWGCSPSYYKNTYPNVSDDVDDLEGRGGDDPSKKSYDVKYFSYNEIKNGINTTDVSFAKGIAYNADAADGKQGYFYTRETTTYIEAIKNVETGNPVASVASVVLVGHYLVDDATTPATFYVKGETYYADEAKAKAAFIASQQLLFKDDQGTKVSATDADLFVVEHPKKAVRGTTPVAGRFVTLQLKAVPTPAIYYRNGSTYEVVTADNINNVNRMLWQGVHTMEVFNNGRGFFNIPIQHLGYPTTPTAAKAAGLIDDKGNYQWDKMRLGDFGVVRNHAYNINVTGIKGLATGLRDDNQPIVPPKDAVDYYVAAKLNVLAWAVVPQQDVEL